jgi:hypothetical protein
LNKTSFIDITRVEIDIMFLKCIENLRTIYEKIYNNKLLPIKLLLAKSIKCNKSVMDYRDLQHYNIIHLRIQKKEKTNSIF